ncbi:MAG: flavin reductase [Clostridiales bacterium 43-6]|nr:MAG: flavin reductase [Clostridiales bacterium 43-6]
MAFKEITAKELEENPFRMIADEWMLVTAGNEAKFNTMTASWGFLGEMWNKDVAVTVVRPQRYTYEFIEKEELFTLSFYGDRKDIHKTCGTKSGRDVDKVAEIGLTPVFSDGTVFFEEARIVLVCKKIFAQDIKEESFIDKDNLKWYPEKDFHRAYFGEILKVYVK